MTQINLLPWREHARQIRKARFSFVLIASVSASLFILIVWHIYVSHTLNVQLQLNDLLQTGISQEQASLNDMSSKEDEKNIIDNQLHFIMNLYASSYSGVRLLNELVSLVPPSISLSSIERNGKSITLAGTANTDDDVTLFLQAIAKSSYFRQPVLTMLNQERLKEGNKKYFELNVIQKE
jgi:type IV pilus assembly protein PilN